MFVCFSSPASNSRTFTTAVSVTVFILAKKAALTKKKVTAALNPRYRLPSRDYLSNTLIPAWYFVEKQNVIQELAQVSKAASTCDGWPSVSQDHYLTVTLQYISRGHIKQKVLITKAVYESQTGPLVADEVNGILEEFQINTKVVAATVKKRQQYGCCAEECEAFTGGVLCPYPKPGSTEGLQHQCH